MKASYFFLPILLSGCFSSEPEVASFNMFNNYNLSSDTLIMEMDLSQGPFHGITLPSDSASELRDYFHFNFEVRNVEENKRFFYKLYYRNISYKHSDLRDDEFNLKSSENFFGSWSGIDVPNYKLTDIVESKTSITIHDSIKIMGNPFNDERFFGPNPKSNKISNADVEKMESYIRSLPTWLQSIEEKTQDTKNSLEKQIRLDAIWTLRNSQSKDTANLRFRNNPRVGLYEFMLVVGSESVLESLPEFALNHTLIDPEYGVRSNPFYFFTEAQKKYDIVVKTANQHLRTFAILKPDYGLYYDKLDFEIPYTGEDCQNDLTAFEKAHFIQYLNSPVMDSSLNNIDQMLDVVNKMSLDQFNGWAKNSNRNDNSFVTVPNKPCENAAYNSEENALLVINPGNSEKPFRKENGGIEGRFGFTFGKFKALIDFPEILSDEHVWNGVTCAFWLKFLSLDEWNNRDVCEAGEGYVLEYLEKNNTEREARAAYSEIDIEIVKASNYWPPLSYNGYADTVEFDNPSSNHDLIISCTNWDLACKDPSQFGVGAKSFNAGENTYFMHRWGDWYKALTSKNAYPHDKTVGQPLWYEIDWGPTSITWRIGKSREEMEQICYMDSSITKIPNNAMNPVVSQEFHYGHWWPTSPFQQGDIPYPEKDIVGKVIEIRIE
jgi:hypothetical protein